MCSRTSAIAGIICLSRLVVDPSAPDKVPFFSIRVIFIRFSGHMGERNIDLSLIRGKKARKFVLYELPLGDVMLAVCPSIRAKWVLRSSTTSCLLLALVVPSVDFISCGKVFA